MQSSAFVASNHDAVLAVVEATLPSMGIFSCIMGLRFLGSLCRCIKSNAQIQCHSGNTQEI